MKKVNKIIDFPKGCLIAPFNGRTTKDAEILAIEWENRNKNIEIISYYEQELGTKKSRSILVAYKFKES